MWGNGRGMQRAFRQRYETRRPANLIDGIIPLKARSDLVWIVVQYATGWYYTANFRDVWNDLFHAAGEYRRAPDDAYNDSVRRSLAENYIASLVREAEWDLFYELIEILARWVKPDYADWLHNAVNELMLTNYLAYRMVDGRVERVGTELEDLVVAEARGILRDPELSGPNDQFLKAVGFLSRRPEPDKENCVKDAVGAVEGMARVLLSNHSILLSDAIKKIGDEKGVHKTLQKLFQDLYAFRGDAEGAAHGSSGAGYQISTAGAEITLNTAGAMIVYLARIYERGIQ